MKKLLQFLRILWYRLTYRFRPPRIKVYQARISGIGSFIDVRYHLSRPDLLTPNPVYLQDQVSGQKLTLLRMPKFGPVRSKHNRTQAIGLLLFRNTGNLIQPGAQVTLVLGSLVVKDILVQ